MAKSQTELVIEEETTVPPRTRGRQFDPQTLQLKEQFLASEKDGRARSIMNVKTQDERNEWGRKLRSAANAIDPEYKIETRWDRENNKLVFGPEDVIKKLDEAQKANRATKATKAPAKAS